MKSIKSTIGNSGVTVTLFLLIFFIHIGAFFLIKEHGLIVDERFHYAQIVRFMNFDYKPDPTLPMIPGYHYIISSIGRIFGIEKISYYQGVPYIRFISFLFNLASIVVFYKIALEVDKRWAIIKTIQFSFVPILFPFFSLLYTDLFSNFVILLALLAIYKRAYFLAAFIGSMAILIRQNNLVWLVFFNALIYFREFGYTFSVSKLKEHLKKTYPFLFGLILLGISIFINRGLAVGVESKYFVFFTLAHTGNIFIILFYFFIIFLPIILDSIGDIFKLIVRKKIYLVSIPLLYPIYNFSFVNSHPLNGNPFFIHNAIPMFFTANGLHKFFLFLIIVISLFSLFVTRLNQKYYYSFYLVTFLYLLPLWLIDSRYYTVPFTLFLLFRVMRSVWIEYLAILFFIILSFYLYYGVWSWKFFL